MPMPTGWPHSRRVLPPSAPPPTLPSPRTTPITHRNRRFYRCTPRWVSDDLRGTLGAGRPGVLAIALVAATCHPAGPAQRELPGGPTPAGVAGHRGNALSDTLVAAGAASVRGRPGDRSARASRAGCRHVARR